MRPACPMARILDCISEQYPGAGIQQNSTEAESIWQIGISIMRLGPGKGSIRAAPKDAHCLFSCFCKEDRPNGLPDSSSNRRWLPSLSTNHCKILH